MLFVLAVAPARADWGTFAKSYEYMTSYRGGVDLELYTDMDGTKGVSKNQIELEYGITDHWMASLYGVATSGGANPFQFNQVKLETRYRFGERGQFVVDPAVYLEYKTPTVPGNNPGLEAKMILGKQTGIWNSVANLEYETDLTSSAIGQWNYTFGTNTEVAPGWRVGFEAVGEDLAGAAPTENLGPVVSGVLGSTGFRLNTWVGFALNQHSESIVARTKLAFGF